MKLNTLLKGYDTLVLDMDGVVTGEAVYWDTAALTVWELLNSRYYFGSEALDPALLMKTLPDIRKKVFVSDEIIKLVKARGINNNWDLAWLVVSGALIHQTMDFEKILAGLKELPETAIGMYQTTSMLLREKAGLSEIEGTHHQGLWLSVQYAFQEWFLGSDLFAKHWGRTAVQPGKPGLTFQEEPIVDKTQLIQLLGLLSREKRVTVGTGRPRIEILNSLTRWQVLNCFAPDGLVTYGDVQVAQAQYPDIPLTKPHPFTFLKAIFGETVSNHDLIAGRYDKKVCQKTLVIGDAGCDLFAAKKAGCDFAAVLTGIEGEAARGYFEKEQADFILHNILDLLEK